jgi:hypothetical protein
MSRFCPQATFITDEGLRQFHNKDRKSRNDVNVYSTYAKLKTAMGAMLRASFDERVSVVRSRRGKFGEWFEHWEMISGKPTIVKEGWN